MQIFDYHINPKIKKGLIIKSFYAQGETREEQSLGDLCIVSELSNSLSRDSKILNNLNNTIKKEFFSQPSRGSEQSLIGALKKGNRFLEKLSQQGNIRWLGNLQIAIFCLKDYNAYFSRIGNIKLLLLRGSEYHNIGENIEFQKSSSNKPNQPFVNVASGQLTGGDRIIILTQNIFDFFYQNLAEKLITHPELTSRGLSKILKEQKQEMKKISGIFFLIFINQIKSKKLPFLKIKLPAIRIKKEILLVIALILILLLSYLIFK